MMTSNQALQRVMDLLDRLEGDPAAGGACATELRLALEVLEDAGIDVPPALQDLNAQLQARKRADEAIETNFDNMPV